MLFHMLNIHVCVQLAFARGLITFEERARVIGIMQRFNLPLWHPVCSVNLFMKVRPPDAFYNLLHRQSTTCFGLP